MGSPGELAPRVVAKDPERIRCVYCHDQVVDLAVSCGECHAVLHPECGASVDRCPTLGCGARLGKPRALGRRSGLRHLLAVPGALVAAAIGRARELAARVGRWSLAARLFLVLATALVLLLAFLFVTVLGRASLDAAHRESEALLARAHGALDAHRPADALLAIDEAIGAGPGQVDLWLLRARAHELAHDAPACLADLTHAIALAPDDGKLIARRGWLRLAAGDEAGAGADARLALAKGASASSWALRASIDIRNRAFDQAVEDARVATSADPNDARAWHSLARGFEGQRNLEAALACYNRAVELDPQLGPLRIDRAWARLHAGRAALAEADATAAIGIDSGSAVAHTLRGAARLELGQNAGAIEDATRAIELDATTGQPWQIRGTARLALKDSKGAIDDLNRAIVLSPSNARAYFSRAWAYWDLGFGTLATADLESFLDMDPDSPDAPRARWLLNNLQK